MSFEDKEIRIRGYVCLLVLLCQKPERDVCIIDERDWETGE